MYLEFITLNSTGLVRRERMGGRAYLVAPFTSIGPRVLPGSKGLLYYPKNQIEANPGVWNSIPVTAGHPVDPLTNEALSASYGPEYKQVRKEWQIGFIANDAVVNGWRKGEAWYDEELTKNISPETYAKLVANEPFDLSTGLYTDNTYAPGITRNGQAYDYIAFNYRPDHLAALPNQRGACSVRDGCGMLINDNPEGINQYTKGGKGEAHKASKDAHAKSKALGVSMDHPALANAGKAVEASKAGDHAAASEAHLKQMDAHATMASRAKSIGDKEGTEQNLAAAKAHRDASMAHQASVRVGNALVANPFANDDQRRACYAADDPNWDCEEWDHPVKNKSFWHRLGEAFGMTFSQPGHLHSAYTVNAWSDAAREAAKAARKASYAASDKSESAGDYEDEEEYRASDQGKHADTAIEHAHNEDHAAAAESHRQAARAHIDASEGMGTSHSSEQDHITAAKSHLAAAKLHDKAASLKATTNVSHEQPRHQESGQYLPKGANRGEKQLQAAVERGFSHLIGDAAPSTDVDDDGDEDTPEFGEAGGRVEPGMEMDHHPMPTDRGPKTPTGNEGDSQSARIRVDGKELEHNEEDEGGTGMKGDPMHIGPTAPTGNAAKKCPKCGDAMEDGKCDCGYTANASHGELHSKLQGQLDAKTTRDKPSPSIHEVHDDHVVYHDGEGYKRHDHEDGQLTGKPVPVKPVTSFQPVNNEVPMTLTSEQRRRAVGYLTVNECTCKGKEKVLLNRENYSDDEIVEMVKNAQKNKKNALVANAATQAGFVFNDKAQSSSADQTAESKVDANDSKNKNATDDEESMYKKDDVKGPASLNAWFQQQFGMSVEEAKQVLNFGGGSIKGRKAHLVSLLTQNQHEPQAKAMAAATFNKLSVPELEVLANGLRPTQNALQPVFGPELDEEVFNTATTEQAQQGPDVLPMPTWNSIKQENRQRA